jgi:hypothetical protein
MAFTLPDQDCSFHAEVVLGSGPLGDPPETVPRDLTGTSIVDLMAIGQTIPLQRHELQDARIAANSFLVHRIDALL